MEQLLGKAGAATMQAQPHPATLQDLTGWMYIHACTDSLPALLVHLRDACGTCTLIQRSNARLQAELQRGLHMWQRGGKHNSVLRIAGNSSFTLRVLCAHRIVSFVKHHCQS